MWTTQHKTWEWFPQNMENLKTVTKKSILFLFCQNITLGKVIQGKIVKSSNDLFCGQKFKKVWNLHILAVFHDLKCSFHTCLQKLWGCKNDPTKMKHDTNVVILILKNCMLRFLKFCLYLLTKDIWTVAFGVLGEEQINANLD